jgi:hypothetical protein
MRKLIQFRVEPLALTACGLPQKTIRNPKYKIRNRHVRASAGFARFSCYLVFFVVPAFISETTKSREMPLLRLRAASLRRRFCLGQADG